MLRRALLALVVTAVILGLTLTAVDFSRAQDAREIKAAWEKMNVSPVQALGAIKSIEVTPLVNWHASGPEFQTEPGVSYLLRVDDQTILFDVGYNQFAVDPSPLEHNMGVLGIQLSDIDMVFLSHAHRDHMGGEQWSSMQTFSPYAQQADLRHARIVAPVPLRYPNAKVEIITGPQRLSEGVASTGPIARRLFIGRIDEQALVLNLEGKGLVVVVGCGHQTVPKLLSRVEAAFDEPIYGLIGDLHYPLPEGRLKLYGIDAQRRLASGDGIFKPISRDQMQSELAQLDDRLNFLMLGGHDTSDEVLKLFTDRFQGRFHSARVGQSVLVD